MNLVKYFTLSIILLCTGSITAQDYRTSLGIRIGTAQGLTVKHFVSPSSAFEGMITSIYRGANFTGLYELHHPAFQEPGMKFFYGVGGHIGVWNGYPHHPWFYDDRVQHSVIGVDGIIGLEYTFQEIPLNLGLDWKPAFNIVEYTGFWFDNFGVSVRYAVK